MKKLEIGLCAILTLLIGFCCGGGVFFAAQELHVATQAALSTAAAAAQDGTTIFIDDDITMTEIVSLLAEGNVTIASAGETPVTLFMSNDLHFYVAPETRLTLRNIILDGGYEPAGDDWSDDWDDHGGIHNFGQLTFGAGVTVKNCYAGNNGGGVANFGQMTASEGLVIEHCYASNNGGGIANWGEMTDLAGLVIKNCHAGHNGGGGIVNWGQMTIEEGLVIEKCSARSGGGICSYDVPTYDGQLTVKGGIIKDNSANGGYGGGIYSPELSKLTVRDCSFDGNTAAQAHWMTDEADIALYQQQITGVTQLSAAPEGYPAFVYAYNNYDIGYTKGMTDPEGLDCSAGFDGAVTARIDNRTGEAQSGTVTAAVYDAEGVLVAIETVPFYAADGDAFAHTFGLDTAVYPADQFQIHVFFWDGTFAPLIEAAARA